jgi:hypothetical protein
MKVRLAASLVMAAGVGLAISASWADDLKSGNTDRIGGSFTVKAITGGQKGKSLCYV